jgi:hypothetical protein
MQRVWEILLGLKRGFLSQQGDFALSFNPQWPGQQIVGAGVWNVLLAIGALLLVIYVYRHEGKTRRVKIVLGVIRATLLALVIALLNRPVLTLAQSRTEASVVAIMIDDSISMRVRDVAPNGSEAQSRLEGAVTLLGDKDRGLIRDLSSKHTVKLYRFDSTAQPITPKGREIATGGSGAGGGGGARGGWGAGPRPGENGATPGITPGPQ